MPYKLLYETDTEIFNVNLYILTDSQFSFRDFHYNICLLADTIFSCSRFLSCTLSYLTSCISLPIYFWLTHSLTHSFSFSSSIFLSCLGRCKATLSPWTIWLNIWIKYPNLQWAVFWGLLLSGRFNKCEANDLYWTRDLLSLWIWNAGECPRGLLYRLERLVAIILSLTFYITFIILLHFAL